MVKIKGLVNGHPVVVDSADPGTPLTNVQEDGGDIVATNAAYISLIAIPGFLAVQAEIDDTQTGAGLGTDGSYSATGGANYINAATDLDNADQLLDTQIKVNADEIASNDTDIATNAGLITGLQTELDDTQTGAGLGTDGTYSATGGSNYLGAATSLDNADQLLDAQIKVNETDVDVLEEIHENVIVWSDGVADWNGTTGTDNGTSWDSLMTTAFSQSGHTRVIIPPGRYWLGTTSRTFTATSEVTIEGIGDVELAGTSSGQWIFAFVGERTSDTARAAVTLNGDHLRTARLGQDGFTRYDGVVTYDFNETHNAVVGEELHLNALAGLETWWTGWGTTTFHMGDIIDVPTTTSVTIAQPSLFDFLDTQEFFISGYNGPVHLKNISVINYNDAASKECVRFYRVSNSTIDNCYFAHNVYSTTNEKDAVLISDGRNWLITNSKFEKCRYGLPVNYSHGVVARDNECNNCRHFLTPTDCYDVLVENVRGRNNVSIVDGHGSIYCRWHNVMDEGAQADPGKSDLFNCRNIGFVLRNVYWDGYSTSGTGNKNIYLGIHSGVLLAKYENLLRRFPDIIENVTLNSRTEEESGLPLKTHIGQAGQVLINGWQLSGTDELLLGIIGTGIEQLEGLETVTGYESLNTGTIGGSDPDVERYSGTSTAASATSITVPAGATESSPVEDFHIGSLIQITSGPGAGDNRRITDYTVVGGGGSDHIITVAPAWTTNPTASGYEVNCTNIKPGALTARIAPHWGIDRKRLSPDAVGSDQDLYPYRVRLFPIATDSEALRYESVTFTLIASTNASATPGRAMWKWLFDYKSVPSRTIDGPWLIDQQAHRWGRKMTAAISDVVLDPSAGAAPGWFEFTITLTSEESQTGLFIEAETLGGI